jgi:hypothetical protein
LEPPWFSILPIGAANGEGDHAQRGGGVKGVQITNLRTSS